MLCFQLLEALASLRDDLFSPATILAVLGILATGWGISRSGAVSGWKSVAEARKERIAEIEATQARVAEREAVLVQKIADLEKRGDVSAVLTNQREIIARLDSLKEAVDDLAGRWG